MLLSRSAMIEAVFRNSFDEPTTMMGVFFVSAKTPIPGSTFFGIGMMENIGSSAKDISEASMIRRVEFIRERIGFDGDDVDGSGTCRLLFVVCNPHADQHDPMIWDFRGEVA